MKIPKFMSLSLTSSWNFYLIPYHVYLVYDGNHQINIWKKGEFLMFSCKPVLTIIFIISALMQLLPNFFFLVSGFNLLARAASDPIKKKSHVLLLISLTGEVHTLLMAYKTFESDSKLPLWRLYFASPLSPLQLQCYFC